MADWVGVRFRSSCSFSCSFPSTTRLCRRDERSATGWINCTRERPSWIRSTTVERSDCPTPRTPMWSGRARTSSRASGERFFCEICGCETSSSSSPFFFLQPVGDESQARVVELVGRKPGIDGIYGLKGRINNRQWSALANIHNLIYLLYLEFDFKPRGHVELGEELGLVRQRWAGLDFFHIIETSAAFKPLPKECSHKHEEADHHRINLCWVSVLTFLHWL